MTQFNELFQRNLNSVKQISIFDGYNLPFSDHSFDLATCSHVIEHVEFPRQLIREILRVSKEQIFEVPIDFTFHVDNKIDLLIGYGHINVYTPASFRYLLKSVGLEILYYRNSLYNMKVYNYINKNKSWLSKTGSTFKRSIRNLVPFIKEIKPDVTTVKTKISDKKVQILTSPP